MSSIHYSVPKNQFAYRRVSVFKEKITKQEECISHDSDSTCEEPKLDQIKFRPKIKVELCRNFLENKICPYKQRCRFAHGLQELLRNTDLGQNFRTKKCKVFCDKKQCRFGERCNFKHSGGEYLASRIIHNPNILKNYPEVFLGYRQQSKIISSLDFQQSRKQ